MKTIRLSEQAKNQLAKLKRKTGVSQWNILCRWGFCYSLAESTKPTDMQLKLDSNVEMTFDTFGGEHKELYLIALKQWLINQKMETTDESCQKWFNLHLHRGISYLSHKIASIEDLLELGFKPIQKLDYETGQWELGI